MKIKNTVINSIVLVGFCLLASIQTYAQTAVENIDFAAFPPTSEEAATPLVMLTMSRDHQYFFKAYSDFSDLDPDNNDGPEVTYENNIEYFGYFDPNKCYNYSSADGRFVPQSFQEVAYYCDDVNGGEWSGNFLNWATMTRMDVVRKIFYGGLRSTDTATLTVLERAHLPTDAHSFAKYYNGDDLFRLTPFDASDNVVLDGRTGDPNPEFDDFEEGITICNTTPDFGASSNGNAVSQTSNAPPVMRVVRGNYALWGSNERWQCTWDDEATGAGGPNSDNGNEFNGFDVIANGGSGIDAADSDPDRNDDSLPAPSGVDDRILRVEVCSDESLIDLAQNGEDCRAYPNGNFKPAGALHQFGEDGQILFGLMTGGFQANTEGGILRKNIRGFDDEVNEDTDGTFTGVAGIVSNIDALRMFGYRYNNGTYFGGNSGDTCSFQQTDIAANECISWGNPISEIIKESVNFLSGGNPTAAFNVDDTGRLPGLTTEDWINPLDEENMCAAVTQIVVNASVSSFDENTDLGANFPGNPDVNTFTDDVGDIEGISGNSFFVGITADDADETCTAKTINNLSSARGICPDAPTVAGSYAAGGIAFYAATTDLRTDLEGEQNIETLGITLTANTPVINVPLGSVNAEDSINIIPAYRLLLNNGGVGGGAIVDFKIVQQHTETATGSGIFTGAYYINWEDSEQGGDFDNDVWGTIVYSLDTNVSPAQITITTDVIDEATVNDQLFGFITAGTTQDGFHAFSGIEGADYIDPLNLDTNGNTVNPLAIPQCNNCQEGDAPVSHTFVVSTDGVQIEPLEAPLYYASKFGSFNELGGEEGPDQQAEFDVLNNFTGAQVEGGDGIPDGFFAATSPQALVDALDAAFGRVLAAEVSSGAAPANLANSDGSGGLITQGVFFESVASTDGNGDTITDQPIVTWTGELQGFFIGPDGLFHEDTNSNGILDDSDVIFDFEFDPEGNGGEGLLSIVRSELQDPDSPFDEITNPLVTIETVPADQLNTIWSASNSLSNLDNDAIVTNRQYDSAVEIPNDPSIENTSGASRFIFTWIDSNGDGEAQQSEVIPFESSEVAENSAFQGYLGFTGDDPELNTQARNIVDFIRGFESGLSDDPDVEDLGFRNRTITDNGVENVVKRLGDIVNSTPIIVGAPSETFDISFGDSSYADFRNQYADRRNMVYVGGNDGLLHAFNGGFDRPTLTSDIAFFENNSASTATEHDLGAEIWAYAPKNLLPHYQWLAEPDYLHVFYVDGEPASFDVNIFPDDAVHPGGWGTILVVGMRLGGGDFPLGFDNDNDGEDETARSSYIVLDVTDPEQPPVLLGEISHEDLRHTTSQPTITTRRVPNAGFNFNNLTAENNRWTLVFGSGPDDRVNFTSSDEANIFTLDLSITDGRLTNTEPDSSVVPSGNIAGVASANAFVGSLTTTDWTNDFIDDVVYFGTVEGGTSPTDQSGGLFRYVIPQNGFGSGSINLMLDTDRPISSSPLTMINEGQNFVYAGTGRFLHQPDSSIQGQELYVGIREQESGFTQTFTLDQLLDITDISVFQDFDENGAITSTTVGNAPGTSGNVPVAVDLNGDGITTFEEFSEYILSGGGGTFGWQRLFNVVPDNPSEGVVADSATLGPLLLFTAFTPSDDICLPIDGATDIFAVDLVTGTASPLAPLQAAPTASGDSGGSREVDASQFLGIGAPSDISIFQTINGDAIALSGLSTGEVGRTRLRLAADPGTRRINWREIIQ